MLGSELSLLAASLIHAHYATLELCHTDTLAKRVTKPGECHQFINCIYVRNVNDYLII